jgi:hypothetical protein
MPAIRKICLDCLAMVTSWKVSPTRAAARRCSLVLLLTFSGCDTPDPSPTSISSTPMTEVDTSGESPPSNYDFLNSNHSDADSLETAVQSLPFNEIQLERTECYGTCPSYVITLRSDGTATYVGRNHVAQIGKYSGNISGFDFGKLCWAIEKLNLLNLEPKSYASGTVDHPTTTLRIKKPNDETPTEIVEDGLPGPIELWVVQNSIDQVASRIIWRPTQDWPLSTPTSSQLLSDASHITLLTPKTSSLQEQIRVPVSGKMTRRRLMQALNQLKLGKPQPLSTPIHTTSWVDVEFILVDSSGFERRVGISWDDPDHDRVAEGETVYQIESGIEMLKQLIAEHSGLAEFGGLKTGLEVTP